MSDWLILRKRIEGWEIKNRAAKSYRNALLQVIEKAEKWDLAISSVSSISNSNLREIASIAKLAIAEADKERLEELLRMAAQMTTTELRNELRTEKLEEITVVENLVGTEPRYTLEVTGTQLERIKNSTSRNFTYRIEETEN